MPLQRRVPKFGFKNNNKIYYKAINLDALELLATKVGATALTIQVMVENGIVGKNDRVKILGRGELKAKVTVEAPRRQKRLIGRGRVDRGRLHGIGVH